MEFFEVIHKRRSVRQFAPKELPAGMIERILEAGRLAPSGGNGQNHYFGVVKDQKRKEELAEAAGNQDWIASAPVVIALCANVEYDLANAPEDDFGRIVNEARFGREMISYLNAYPDRKAMNVFWNNACPLIPGEHMLLAATSFGLSGCWIGYLDTAKASKILDLPDDVVCLFLLPLGFAAEEPGPIDRKSLDEIAFYEKWAEGAGRE